MTVEPQGKALPAGATAGRDPLYARGVGLVLTAGCFWSIAGVLVRAIEGAGIWQILFYRSAALVIALACILLVRHRGRIVGEFRKAGLGSVIGGFGVAVAFAGFIYALLHTTVANALFILCISPLTTALLAWLVLREGVRRATLIATAIAFIGVGIMVADGVQSGALWGNLASLVSVLGFSVFAVSLRRGRATDMLPTALIGGIFAAVAAAFLVDSFAISASDFLLSATMGVVQIAAGMVFFIAGSRYLPAAELALLSLTEVVLGPILVWLAYAEVPSGPTLLGGAIVLTAIAGQALSGIRRKPPPIGAV